MLDIDGVGIRELGRAARRIRGEVVPGQRDRRKTRQTGQQTVRQMRHLIALHAELVHHLTLGQRFRDIRQPVVPNA